MTAVPERGAEYGEQVWEALRPRLVPYERKAPRWNRFFGKGWASGEWGRWRLAVWHWWLRRFWAGGFGSGTRK